MDGGLTKADEDIMKVQVQKPSRRPGLTVRIAGMLAALLWIGRPFYLNGVGMQIIHPLSLLLVLGFLISKVVLGDYVIFRIGKQIYSYTLGIFSAVAFILIAGILSGLNALSLVEVLKFEAGYLVGLIILIVFLACILTDEDVALVSSCLLMGGVLTVVLTFSGYFIPWVAQITFNSFGRAQGLVHNPNQLGMMLAAIIPLAATYLAADYRRFSRWLIFITLVAGLVISGSKTNLFISALLCPLAVFIVSGFQDKSSKRLLSLVGALFVTASGGLLTSILLRNLAPKTLRNLQIFFADPEGYRSLLSRQEVWLEALAIVKEHPFLGIGAGNTPLVLARSHAHNVFIEHYLTMGLLGMSALVAFLICLLLFCWHMLKISRCMPFIQRARVTGLVLGIFSYILSNQLSDSFGPTTMPVFWVLIGVLLAQGNSWILEKDREGP